MEQKKHADIKMANAWLQKAEELYTVICDSTRLPYVECDSETCDDEILLFETKEAAEKRAEELADRGYRVRAARVSGEHRLGFLSNLYPLGVNGMLICKAEETPLRLQLKEVVERPELPRFTRETQNAVRKGQKPKCRLENPELQLTAIYFTQLSGSAAAQEREEEIRELQEEMMVHYREACFIALRTRDGKTPLIKRKDGAALQPIFTDMQELSKFQQAVKDLKADRVIVTEAELSAGLAEGAAGVAVNPLGVNLMLQLKKKQPEQS